LWRFGRGVRPTRRWLLGARRSFYGDLNLSTPQGAETLHRRIKAAAEQACGEGYQPGDLARASVYYRCVNAASERALQKVQVAFSQVQWVVK
jgi:UrcA family protein